MKTIGLLILGLLCAFTSLPGPCDDAPQDPDEGIQMDVPPVGGWWIPRMDEWSSGEHDLPDYWERWIETPVKCDASSLVGVCELGVLVNEESHTGLKAPQIRCGIEEEARRRLKAAGVRLLAGDRGGAAFLRIAYYWTDSPEGGGEKYVSFVELWERVRPVGRQGNELWAVTWQSGQRVGGWRGDSSIIIDAVTDKLEDFVEDLVAANPEQAKMPAHDTALLAAAERGDVTEVARLLESGADPNAIEGYASGHFDDTSPLYLAAQGGHLEVVRRLLARGADANQAVSSWLGQTALMVAAERGHADTLRALLEAGADVNAVDEIGRTSLHLVASRGHRLAAEILLKHGAEVNASDRNGQTALAVAVKEGHEELAAMLREHGGKE